jgi:hypothetical protein
MTTEKSITFQAKNVKPFTSWLKRFSSINNSLLLEIDRNLNCFISKVYNEERSCVKMSKINFDDAGLITKPGKDIKRIKVGIFNISRLIKIIDQFNDAEFNLIINYDEVVGDDSISNYAGKDIQLKNKTLKMSVDCTSLNIFKYITDELFKDTIAKIEVVGEFELAKTMIEKINSLCVLDNEHKFIEFKFIDEGVVVAGKSFQLLLEERKDLTVVALNIFKDQFSNVDVENYNVHLGEDRLVFHSKDSETISVISMAVNN